MDIILRFTDPKQNAYRYVHQQLLELPDNRDTLLGIADLLEKSMQQDLEAAGMSTQAQPVSNLRLWIMEHS